MSCFEMPVKELVSIRTVPCLRLSKAARAPEERRGLAAFAMRVRTVRVAFFLFFKLSYVGAERDVPKKRVRGLVRRHVPSLIEKNVLRNVGASYKLRMYFGNNKMIGTRRRSYYSALNSLVACSSGENRKILHVSTAEDNMV